MDLPPAFYQKFPVLFIAEIKSTTQIESNLTSIVLGLSIKIKTTSISLVQFTYNKYISLLTTK